MQMTTPPPQPKYRKYRNRENGLKTGMASWRVHRGVEWCLYDPQTPRETRDTGFLGELYTKTALSINLAKTGKRLAYP